MPGTLKRPVPFLSKLPIIGGDKRTVLDNLFYVAHIFFLFRACFSANLAGASDLILPTIIILPILGLMDRMIFLNARGEITWIAYFCFLFPIDDTVSALKVIWIGIWFWAAISKINKHFAGVICVMFCNNPFFRSPLKWFKRRLYQKYPDDLRPGPLAKNNSLRCYSN